MAFLKLTRDRRGYENTFLMHAPHPGARPVVLYWYRSAPGVRVGRPALDEEAIRTIEEQHPDIEFDWPHILEVGAIIEPEVEERPARPKRRQSSAAKPPTPPPERTTHDEAAPVAPDATQEVVAGPADVGPPAEEAGAGDLAGVAPEALDDELATGAEDTTAGGPGDAAAPKGKPHDLLEELVGHEIATRLHARYSEIVARIHQISESDPRRAAWEARAEALNPDSWVTPDEILRGVSHADELFDSLRKELLAH